MNNIEPRLYTFIEDAKACALRIPPIQALRAIALDALLLAQDIENEQERSDSNEGELFSAGLPVIDSVD
jgi:hypothetical protein